jgi:hypothetical protein
MCEPDSQDHWIRKCQHTQTRMTRAQALDNAIEANQKLIFTKGHTQVRRECYNLYSALLQQAESDPGGEQLWLRIIPAHIVTDLSAKLNPAPLDTSIRLTSANLWKRSLKTILAILMKAAKTMWSIKEEVRRGELGLQRTLEIQSRRGIKRGRQSYIRLIGYLQCPPLSFEEGSIDVILSNDSATAPSVATRRLQRISSRLPSTLSTKGLKPTCYHDFLP